MLAALSAPTAPAAPELIDACGAEPGSACRFVFDLTSNEAAAEVVDFLVHRPLRILLIVMVAWLLVRVMRRLIGRFARRLVGSAQSGGLRRARERTPGVLLGEAQPTLRSASRAETISQVLRSLGTVVVSSLAVAYVMAELGLQLGPLLAGAGVAGVAIGFGAQSLVKDFLSGVFMLLEDQYGVGDVVDVGEASGTVEAVSLRTTRIRDVNGTVWYVPNGEIRRVGNKSQQWARALLDIVVAHGTEVDEAERVLKTVADRVCAEGAIASEVLEEPEVWGVEAFGPEGITLRLVVKTRPGSQWTVMRALRIAIQSAFAEKGIDIPPPAGSVIMPTSATGSTAPKEASR